MFTKTDQGPQLPSVHLIVNMTLAENVPFQIKTYREGGRKLSVTAYAFSQKMRVIPSLHQLA